LIQSSIGLGLELGAPPARANGVCTPRLSARVEQALRLASSRTPEPFTPKNGYQPSVADIDVRPYDVERNHAGYLLKGIRRYDRTEFSSDDLLRESGLIVLPHLTNKKPSTR
jgi:hypothetical protein